MSQRQSADSTPQPRDNEDTHASYRERLGEIGLDVTQLRIDVGDTIAPPSKRLAHEQPDQLEPLGVARSDGGSAELTLQDTLGVGGMGVVKLASQRSLRRRVAVKLLSPEHEDAEGARELIREARITGLLAHPNVVPIHALGLGPDQQPAFVMKHITGRPWSELLELEDDQLPTEGDALSFHIEILMQVSQAVHFAHAKGIVHRDLKPSNVMVGEFGEVYLLDWGLAVSVRDDADEFLPRAVDIHHVAGTPAYMAPEMAAARGEQIDARTDVYLLGATLFEILTGETLHDAETLFEALASANSGRAPMFDDDLPVELVDVCRRAIQFFPSQRYQSAETFRLALGAFNSHRSSRELCDEAMLRVETLRTLLAPGNDPSMSEVHRLSTEARFALNQALRIWPENPEAQRCLRSTLELVIQQELARENRDWAAALLSEHPQPPPLFQEQLEELDTVLAERATEVARLADLERRVNPAIAAPIRRRLALLLTVAVAAIRVGFAVADRRQAIGYPSLLAGLALMNAALLFGWLRSENEDATRSRTSSWAASQ